MNKSIAILGTRGIPAAHGGFETFAEQLALYLADKGWTVTVYCQETGPGVIHESIWRGIRLVHIPVKHNSALGSIVFDWCSILHTRQEKNLKLTLGYNTAAFSFIYRLKNLSSLVNMDGLEWKREKWSAYEKAWLYLNERLGTWFANHLIADHPEIKKHLSRHVNPNKISMIPYGANKLDNCNKELLHTFDLSPNSYALVIARPEPENSIFEIVRSFSHQKRNCKLVLLGKYVPELNEYHRRIMNVASNEVLFLGSIYDNKIVSGLRYFCRLYVHGHTVGGTNPSLVEAMGAGSAILAHDNKFNRWVTNNSACYFKTESQCEEMFTSLLDDKDKLSLLKIATHEHFKQNFTWEKILQDYETLLEQYI
ncbi:MAG: DUF1972 domain-containing protein [Caldisericaceae bacterium]|nr:DUF1972 domain-containing protein [Caldisericaceae bacterium]